MSRTKRPVELNFENLPMVCGGALAMVVNEEFQRARRDVRNRPGVKKKRRVSLHIDLEPTTESAEQGEFEEGIVSFEVGSNIPNKGMSIRVVEDSEGVKFSADAPDNARQNTMDFDEVGE